MFKNNITAFLYHILLIILSTLYLIIFVALSPYLGKIYVHPITRGILTMLWAGSYVFVGVKMSIRHRVRYDFLSGLLIAFNGLILWVISIYQTGFTLRPISEELAYLYIPLNIYLNPILQISFLLDIEFNQIIRLIACFIPGILMGVGVKFKRYKYSKRVQKSV